MLKKSVGYINESRRNVVLNVKRKNTLVTILMIICVLMITQIKKTNGQFPIEFYPNEEFSWKINEINNGTNYWLNSSWELIGKWEAFENEKINFTANTYEVIGGRNFLIGELEIGNFSLQTSDYDIGLSLTLSLSSWMGGFICLDDWESLESKTPFNSFTQNQIQEIETTVLGVKVYAMKFYYNDSFQTTELIYEKATGILLSANTSAFGFHLDIQLISSTIPLPSITNSISLFGLGCVLSSAALLVISRKIKQRRCLN